MKIYVKRNLIIAFVVVLLACCFALVFSNVNPTYADGVTIAYEDKHVDETYTFGSKIEVPKAMLKDGDTLYSASAIVNYPSGKTSSREIVTLNESGVYFIEYKALIGGRTIVKTVEFTVDDSLYFVSGNRSTAYYGSHDLVPSKNGVVVSLASGDKFVYNRVIDLKKVTKLDKLLSFFVTPETLGQQDADKIIITFTDVYDSENFVNVTLKKYQSNSGGVFAEVTTYVDANANRQPATSAVVNAAGNVLYNGLSYTVYKNFIMGLGVKFSMIGEPFVEYGKEEFYLSWDYANKIVYAPNASAEPYKMIIDLDDPAFFDDVWGGFKTGEVIMSISGANYNATKLNFVITQLNNEDLSSNIYQDNEKPVITVDRPSNIPNAIVGKPYRLFNATAFDAKAGELLVRKNVYYNYGSSNRISVTVKDGAFVPEKNRLYTIEYSAVDYFGNVAREIIEVRPLEATKDLTISLGDYETSGDAGQNIKIPKATVDHLLSSYSEKIEITCGDETYTPAPGTTFQPLTSGVHTVKYIVWNYVEEEVVTYDIDVSETSEPAFVGDPNLPKYFIKNATYSIDLPNAYHFEDGDKNEVEVSLKVSNDGGAYSSADYKSFKVTANEKVSLKYVATNSGKSAEVVYEVPVVDVNYTGDLSYPNYFKTKNTTAEQVESGVQFTATSNDNQIEFIKGISLNELSVSISIDSVMNDMDKLDLCFTNTADDDHQIVVSIAKAPSGYAELRVNGGLAYLLSYVWGKANSQLLITVDYVNKMILCDNKEISFASSYDGSSEYCVYFSAKAVGVDQEVKYVVTQIGNQRINSRYSNDRMEPIIVTVPFDGLFVVGDKITIKPIMVADVLSTYIDSRLSVTVRDADGKLSYVESVDGVELKNVPADCEYEIEITDIAIYMVEYVAKDSFGNSGNSTVAINVVDKTPPTIEVDIKEDKLLQYVDVGDKIKIAKYEVSDDVDTEVKVLVSVTYPDYTIKEMTESSFVAEEAGKYVITYYVYDSNYNYTTFSYTVIAEDE